MNIVRPFLYTAMFQIALLSAVVLSVWLPAEAVMLLSSLAGLAAVGGFALFAPFTGSTPRRALVREAGQMILVVALAVFVLWAFASLNPVQTALPYMWHDITSAYLQAALLLRLSTLGVRFINRQRRTRLRWSLMALILAFMVIIMLLCGIVSTGVLLSAVQAPVEGEPPITAEATILLITICAVLVVGVGVVWFVMALIPAFLLSSWFSRGLIVRLEQLALAADQMRGGNLGARVTVEGEDEIAQLQTAFNDMAGRLEYSLNELSAVNTQLTGERDTITRLLAERRQLIASVSHELRTPVATLRGYIESALQRADMTSADDLNVMEREIIRLQTLIDDLFTLSRLEVQQLPLNIVPLDVTPVLRQNVEAVKGSAWARGRVEVIPDFAENLPAIQADEGRVGQIVRNLLNNAVRHTPPGGLVRLSAVVHAPYLSIEVSDTGEGIDPHDLPHLFELFFRGKTGAVDSNGAGLGLALVKKFTEAMSGTVQVESAPGKGASFTVSLPLVPPASP